MYPLITERMALSIQNIIFILALRLSSFLTFFDKTTHLRKKSLYLYLTIEHLNQSSV